MKPLSAINGKDDSAARFDVIHSNALSSYSELVYESGGDPASLARDAGIDVNALTGNGLLDYHELVTLLQLTADRLKVSDFGLRLACLQRGGKVIGPVGIVMKNSETVGQALGYCAKHIHAYSLATRVRFKPNRAEHNLLVYLEILLERSIDVRQAVEHALALASFNISDISHGTAQVREVWFRHEPLRPIKDYRDFFGCGVRFEQNMDGIILNESDLLCEVAESDEQVLEMATDFIDARFPSSLPPVHSQVRVLVQRYLGSGDCSFERIAQDMCIHPRTLQRRLRGEGASFETVRDDVRRELTLRLLKQKGTALTHVAHKIGYAETSVLSRSCQRWFGATPEQIRRGAVDDALDMS